MDKKNIASGSFFFCPRKAFHNMTENAFASVISHKLCILYTKFNASCCLSSLISIFPVLYAEQ